MGGRGSTSRIPAPSAPIQMQTAPPNVVPTAQQAQRANQSAFSATDDADYHDLFGGQQYFQSQNLSIDSRVAVLNYLSDQPEPDSMYAMSQNMNTAMASGAALNANQQYVRDGLMDAMHNLGHNINLTRFDHAPVINGLIAQAGIKNADYESLSASQLKKILTGKTFVESKFLSTSYNDFKNAPTSNPFTDRAVKIQYRAKASTQAMMPGNGPGGRLGEIVLAPGQSMKVVDVGYTGNMARVQGTQSRTKKQVVLTIEVG